MPVTFQSVSVVPHLGFGETGGFDVYWTIAGNNFTPSFMVQIAETESGPWQNAIISQVPDLFALGLGNEITNMQALVWFKVQVYNGATLMLTSPAMDHRRGMIRREYLRYREILRRKRLYLDKTPCDPAWLMRRRIYGQRCTVCCDEIIDSPVSSDCTTCYGTGITGGFYPLVEMKGDWFYGSTPRNTNKTLKDTPGPTQVQKSKIATFGVPDAKSEDIWIDRGTGYRYLIEQVVPEAYAGSIIGQQLEVSRLPTQHPAYNFPTS